MQMRPQAVTEDVPVVQRVADVGHAVVGAWRGRVELGRRFHRQRFVRPLGVELAYEVVEARLPLKAAYAGWSGRLLA
jgi:hypothetical protein